MVVDVGEMEIERPKKNENATTVRHFAGELFLCKDALASNSAIR